MVEEERCCGEGRSRHRARRGRGKGRGNGTTHYHMVDHYVLTLTWSLSTDFTPTWLLSTFLTPIRFLHTVSRLPGLVYGSQKYLSRPPIPLLLLLHVVSGGSSWPSHVAEGLATAGILLYVMMACERAVSRHARDPPVALQLLQNFVHATHATEAFGCNIFDAGDGAGYIFLKTNLFSEAAFMWTFPFLLLEDLEHLSRVPECGALAVAAFSAI